MALAGVGLTLVAEVWHTSSIRDKEAELLFVGAEFQRAIQTYYESTPGPNKELPSSLEDLLQDSRYPSVQALLAAHPLNEQAEQKGKPKTVETERDRLKTQLSKLHKMAITAREAEAANAQLRRDLAAAQADLRQARQQHQKRIDSANRPPH